MVEIGSMRRLNEFVGQLQRRSDKVADRHPTCSHFYAAIAQPW